MTTEQRAFYRTDVPVQAVRDLALWFADDLGHGSVLNGAALKKPFARLGASRAYAVAVADLSAGGMSLSLKNRRLAGKSPEPFLYRKALVKLMLDDDEAGEARLMVLARVVAVQGREAEWVLRLRFEALAKRMPGDGKMVLVDTKGRGVDRLAQWTQRCAVKATKNGRDAANHPMATEGGVLDDLD